MQDRYDVIVVGGGSAGAAAAVRLSENKDRRVLLLEAGPDPQPIPELVADPTLQPRLLLEAPYLEMYPTQRKADGSTFYSLAGRIMGGGSSVNVTSIPRPWKYDFDTWVAQGNPEWTYENLLPIMKRLENDVDYPDSPIHGTEGPLWVERPLKLSMPMSELATTFINRALTMGLPLCEDVNSPAPEGVCASPYNVKNGQRQSTTVAYLEQARGRSNLTVIAEAPALGMTVDGRRVTAVQYEKDGQTRTAVVDKVVLSAGVYHTPQLLMLSGIGPAAELERHGIRVRHALDGVGENYHDHAVVYITFEGPTQTLEKDVVPKFRLIMKSDPSRPVPNFHIIPRPPTEIEGLKRMMPVSFHLLEQHNRGRVSLASSDPHDLPLVDAAMLEHPDDVKAMVDAMHFIHDLLRHPSMQRYYGPLIQPGPGVDWGQFARTTHDSYHHGVGTAKMGPASDKLAVVDQNLKVHGMDNLWVADASIMPTVVHANTNLTCIMIGEVVSDSVNAAG